MTTSYNQTSPYYTTQYSQYFLDVMINRPIPKLVDDQYFTINSNDTKSNNYMSIYNMY
jgi:hypothetical protein